MEVALMVSFQGSLLFSPVHKISHHQSSLAIKLSLKLSCLIWCQSNFKVIAAFKNPLHCGRAVLVSSSICLLYWLCVSIQEQRGTGGLFFSWVSFQLFSPCALKFCCRQHRHLLAALVSKAVPSIHTRKRNPHLQKILFSELMLIAWDAYLGSDYLWEDNSYNKQVVVFDWTFTLQFM